MSSYRGLARIGHFLAGTLAGAVVLVACWAIGLPGIFQISWGLAAAVSVWWYLEPGDDDTVSEVSVTL